MPTLERVSLSVATSAGSRRREKFPVRAKHISSHYCSPGCSTEYFHCFLGLCDLPDTAGGQGGLETEHEDIRSHILSFDAAMALIPSGEAANGPLVLSLLWLSMERERLRAGV